MGSIRVPTGPAPRPAAPGSPFPASRGGRKLDTACGPFPVSGPPHPPAPQAAAEGGAHAPHPPQLAPSPQLRAGGRGTNPWATGLRSAGSQGVSGAGAPRQPKVTPRTARLPQPRLRGAGNAEPSAARPRPTAAAHGRADGVPAELAPVTGPLPHSPAARAPRP